MKAKWKERQSLREKEKKKEKKNEKETRAVFPVFSLLSPGPQLPEEDPV